MSSQRKIRRKAASVAKRNPKSRKISEDLLNKLIVAHSSLERRKVELNTAQATFDSLVVDATHSVETSAEFNVVCLGCGTVRNRSTEKCPKCSDELN